VSGFAVTADEEFLVPADGARAANLARGAPDQLGVMANVFDVSGTAVVGEDTRSVIPLLGRPQAHHRFGRKGARSAGPEIFALGLLTGLIRRMLESPGRCELVCPDPCVGGQPGVPRQGRN